MASQVLKSPSYFEREIDLSVRQGTIVGTPATVVGSALKGPAFVPVLLGSSDDFNAKFGGVDPKFVAGYATTKILESKPAVSFIRVLGAGANTTTEDFEATRTTDVVVSAGTVVSESGEGSVSGYGAVQFIAARHAVTASEAFGFPMFTDNSSFSLSGNKAYMVRAALFTTHDARFFVCNTDESFSVLLDDVCTINDTSTDVMYRKFKLCLSSTDTTFSQDDGVAGLKVLTASLNPSDNCYIGKLLNTDPEKFAEHKHLLYLDLPVDAELATVASGSGNSNSVAILSGSLNTSPTSGDTALTFRDMFGKLNTRFKTPKSPWFISQPFGTTEHDLFYVEAIDDGAFANTQYKISIANLKVSSDPRYPFGTFSLLVRRFGDSDTDPQIIEQFSNLSLDPRSDSYIAKIIGDRKITYIFDVEDENDRKFKVSGKFANKSKFIRVIMNESVNLGNTPKNSLPFGFRGLELLNTNTTLTDTAAGLSAGRLWGSGSFNPNLTGSIIPPMPYRFKITRGEVSASSTYTGYPGPTEVVDSRYYWGVKSERVNNVMNSNITSEQNEIIATLTKFQGIAKLDALVTGSAKDTFNNNKFTLAKVALSAQTLSTVTASAAQHMKEAAYIRNGTPDASNYYLADGSYGSRVTFATILNNGEASDFNRFVDFTKFTAVLGGGWDGVNIFDKHANKFNDRATSMEEGGCANGNYTSPGAVTNTNFSGVGSLNNAIQSYRVATNVATDQLMANNNILIVPGQREPLVTDYITQKNTEYGLSFYIMDIPVYDTNGDRIFDGDTGVYVDIAQTANSFDSRAINDHHAAPYFPNFIMDDTTNNRRVTVPASIAAGAAFAYNDKLAYLWFIPAGFNRNALSFVITPQTRINTPDRDVLFDARINPIIKFPGEGYVLFSQVTLKQGKSAFESINVVRMFLEVKRMLANVGNQLVFENASPALRTKFVTDASALLSTIQLQRGIEKFKVTCDESNNNDLDLENNRINASVRILPTRGVEYITVDFIISPQGTVFQ